MQSRIVPSFVSPEGQTPPNTPDQQKPATDTNPVNDPPLNEFDNELSNVPPSEYHECATGDCDHKYTSQCCRAFLTEADAMWHIARDYKKRYDHLKAVYVNLLKRSNEPSDPSAIQITSGSVRVAPTEPEPTEPEPPEPEPTEPEPTETADESRCIALLYKYTYHATRYADMLATLRELEKNVDAAQLEAAQYQTDLWNQLEHMDVTTSTNAGFETRLIMLLKAIARDSLQQN